MRRLLEDFETLFDLDYRVGDEDLRTSLDRAISDLEAHPLQDWGSAGSRARLVSDNGRYVSFHYRPHLFPGMDLKLRLAHMLQFHLLPRALPDAAPLSIAAVMESYCHLSGDLFGWEMLRDGKFLVWIVDMSGHGLRAGLASAVLRVLIGRLRKRGRVDTLVAELNRTLAGCIRPQCVGLFATGFFLAIEPDGTARYASAGHPPMLLRRADGRLEQLPALDRPIGLFAESTYSSRALELAKDDTLLLYTDGLIEATGRDGEEFGRRRLIDLLNDNLDAQPSQLTDSIFDTFSQRQDIDQLEDDVTFLAARF